MYSCLLKNSELDNQFQKYKRRREDVVKDDSGSYAVFTEQGTFASHVSAAGKVLDVVQIACVALANRATLYQL